MLQGGKRGSQAIYIQVCNKGNRQSEHRRSGFKLRNLAFFVWEDAGLWAHCIGSLCTSAVWGRPCFLVHLASCIAPAPQQSPYGRQHLLDGDYICVCISSVQFSQSCLILCDPMDCSPPSFSVHGIFQARILEWVAISFSRGSSQLRDRTCHS